MAEGQMTLSTYLEIDACPGRITAEETARAAADAKHAAALAELINSGAKNYLTTSSGSGTKSVAIDVNLPAGEYVVSFGSLTSTDTDYTTCQIIALNGASVVSASPQLQMERGSNVHGTITLTSAAKKIEIYASKTGTGATGDTVTFSNGMVCLPEAYAITTDFVPYCPTLPELYAMIQAL